MRRIQIPERAATILKTLNAAGFEAYVVGGCVRDSLLGKTPKDWDITTSARPAQVKKLFRRTVDTGIQHGTVTVMMGPEGFEVTTYRIDGDYKDGRHPENVSYTDDLTEDLKRRDFTINAMAYHPDRGLIDTAEGEEDLEKGIVRCVGRAADRFGEDALRMLRAVRFAAQLGFAIEEETVSAIREQAGDLKKISAERIRDELIKILTSPHPEYLKMASELGITAVVLPEYDHIRGVPQFTPYHVYDVEDHTLKTVAAIAPDPILRMTMLLHDFGKPDVRRIKENGRDSFAGHPEVSAAYAETILRRLKYDNYSRQRIVRLVRWHDIRDEITERNVRLGLFMVGDDIFDDLIKVQRADLMGKNPALFEEQLAGFDKIESLYHKILDEGQCYKISQLPIDGNDLIAAGMKPGPQIGETLTRLTRAVIDDQSLRDKDKLMKMI